ncbi:Tm-1-like ATP-binding domain-containing protein [Roseinatronobacter alkalisoli]|uniref:Tm-1-like ATP-binding domain-containing protein n=1 Tax=Roseinatronobacter alkalisoli TaxID=3028235 RepID=A0ABT5T932_9RHOB|nr:Tm-1-like ATP-binding domain-containing protein [Roseinatronobacter sp. HJB301]MDD7971636.1 Tm-1-like ATP-binding domain-containing protein [Roseinatronobacter sp. HJB301]
MGIRRVYVIGTCDTKQAELAYACDRVRAAGATPVLVDVSTHGLGSRADVPATEIAACHPDGADAVLGSGDRGTAVTRMAEALTCWLLARNDIGAVLGLGGSGNTALVTQAMRALPVGVPKLMVSTVASGQVAPYVGATDLGMVHSVTDVAGLNAISRRVIGNAAHAAAGMAQNTIADAPDDLPGVGVTMFGVTTTCVDHLRAELSGKAEPYVFHATGTGGAAMEKLAESGLVAGLLDVTATEIADHLVGGVMPCSPDRYGVVARTGIPWVGSVGAVDMVNFAGRDTVPDKFSDRHLLVHNPQITLMRTTPPENVQIARFLTERLNRCNGPVALFLPLGGVSAVDAPGMPFHDPVANDALFATIRDTFTPGPNRRLIELPLHINDPAFATAMAAEFLRMLP